MPDTFSLFGVRGWGAGEGDASPSPASYPCASTGFLGKRQTRRAVAVEARNRERRKVHGVAPIIHRQQADRFPDQSFAHKHVAACFQEKSPRCPTLPHLAGRLPILRFRHARRIRARRSRVHRAGSLHMPALRADAPRCTPGESDRQPAAARDGWPPAASLFPASTCDASARAARSVPDVPAAMRSGTIPSFIHHTASRESPATARDANGAPLSVRIARGSPHSRNADFERSPAPCRSRFSAPAGNATGNGCKRR